MILETTDVEVTVQKGEVVSDPGLPDGRTV